MTVTPADIEQAAARIAGRVRITPVIEVEVSGRPVVLKLECLQLTGSFKPRGAFNRVLVSWPPPESGIIAASGGNHGAAVAYVASSLGVPAEVFVPESSPAVKRDRIAHMGAELVVVGAFYADALDASRHRAGETKALEVHAFDHPETVAGQGTVARELESQVPNLDTLLVAVGGGGLIAGVAAWYAGRVKVVAVEPRTSPSLHAALEARRPVDVPVSGVATDSLGARRVGSVAFEIAQQWVAGSILVTDEEILDARRWLWDELRVVAEPGGAAALAALLVGAYRPQQGEQVAVLISGANTDPSDF